MEKAKRLCRGDTIGVVSPASPSENKSEVTRGIETLEAMGYKVKLGRNVNKRKGFVAATEAERAEDINQMFKDDAIDAIFVTQGGYGSAQLFEKLDFEAIASNPKIFTGFSDITSLHLAMNKIAGLVTFHGPGMARFNSEDLSTYTEKQFFQALETADPLGEIPLADQRKWLNPIGKGKCQGLLIGGNLTLICASLGTPYEIDIKDKILLIEDVDTEPWIFDHMLCHLRNAGKLQEAAGIVVGECKNCVPFKYEPGFLVDTSLEDVLEYYLSPLGVPVLYGLPLGHGGDLATLPLGVMAELDCDHKIFRILENGVV